MRPRRSIVAAFGALAVVLGVTSLAWACNALVSSPYAQATPSQAAQGALVTVQGSQWAPDMPVSIRWNSDVGEVLAVAQPRPDGSFAKAVTVPANAPAGHYVIVTVQGSTSEAVPFDVASPAGPTFAGGTGAAQPQAQPGATAEPSKGARPAPVSANPAISGTGSASPQAANGPTPGAAPGALPTNAQQPQAGVAAAPSVRSAAGELWSGFPRGSRSAPPASLAELPEPAGALGQGQTLGMGLLVLGTVALMGGFGVAELGRRRVPVLNRRQGGPLS